MTRSSIDAWLMARNSAQDGEIHLVDAKHAAALGLPTLSALHDVMDRLSEAHDYISSAEVSALLSPVLRVATGEARERLRIRLQDHAIEIPGVPTVPVRLLEADDILGGGRP